MNRTVTCKILTAYYRGVAFIENSAREDECAVLHPHVHCPVCGDIMEVNALLHIRRRHPERLVVQDLDLES